MIIDKLLKNPQFLPEIFETMRDGLMVIDNEGYVQLFNRAAEEITGYKKEEVIGKNITMLFDEKTIKNNEFLTKYTGSGDEKIIREPKKVKIKQNK